MDYGKFIESKSRRRGDSGFEAGELGGYLFGFQEAIVRWALRKGRAAVFADCGMGKTVMQLEWAREVAERTGAPVLVLAPLAVAAQTQREAAKFGIPCKVCRCQADVDGPVAVANYEMLRHFDPSAFGGVVLDESSILKAYDGKTKKAICDAFASTPYRLCCTATPAPNDFMELGNHSEFLGYMDRADMLAKYFNHDGEKVREWRLKGWAERMFWDWCATWAVMVRSPADIGFPADGFELPELRERVHRIESGVEPEGRLFNTAASDLASQRRARRDTLERRCDFAAALANGSDEPWVVWCELNDESEYLARAIPGAVEVRGSDSAEAKEEALSAFSEGRARVLVTKPSIAGFGMNWQHCSNVAFVGLSHSYEQYYQAVRRCWRYGQERPVDVHIVATELDESVVANVLRKASDREALADGLVAATARALGSPEAPPDGYAEATVEGDGYTLMLGDCVERVREIADGSVGYTVFSPPFVSLYTFSDSPRDMSNNSGRAEFFEHMAYLADELMRVTMPGRCVSFHCCDLPTSKNHDGRIGLYDFPGDLLRLFEAAGFIFHSRTVIWKDPVQAMYRTKAIGLLNKQKNKDSALSRQGIPDQLITVRKPGDNPEPVAHTDADFPIEAWQRIASPVWMDINQQDTLQYRDGRDGRDEKHICPLQLQVIDRAVALWSNPGDLVLSPFMGIGSEGYQALLRGRRFAGIELKPSYFALAYEHMEEAAAKRDGSTLLDFMRVEA